MLAWSCVTFCYQQQPDNVTMSGLFKTRHYVTSLRTCWCHYYEADTVSQHSVTPTLHILPSAELQNISYRQAAGSNCHFTMDRLNHQSPHVSVQIPRRWITKANTDYRCSRFAKHDGSPLYWHGIFQHLTRQATYIQI